MKQWLMGGGVLFLEEGDDFFNGYLTPPSCNCAQSPWVKEKEGKKEEKKKRGLCLFSAKRCVFSPLEFRNCDRGPCRNEALPQRCLKQTKTFAIQK